MSDAEKWVCDACGALLKDGPEERYRVLIHVHAVYHPDEIQDPGDEDYPAALKRLAEKLADKTPEELEKELYDKFEFILCPRCKAHFLTDPLAREIIARRGFFSDN